MDTGWTRRLRVTPKVVTAIAAGIVVAGAVVLVTVAAGLGLATLVGELHDERGWDGPAHAGESFGVLDSVLSGLAFAALIVTLWIQFHELRLQRQELRMQREAIERSNAELRSTAQASLRMLHVELVKLAIDNNDLARVWYDWNDELSPETYRQFLYANLIFQHITLSMQVADFNEEQMRNSIRLVFSNEIMRQYWLRASISRSVAQIPGTYPWRMARLGNEIYREYEPDAVFADDPPEN